MKTLHVHQLRYHTYGPFDLEVAAGECVCLTGASGAGKTMMLRAIADLDPHDGKVSLDGTQCEDMHAPDWRRMVGFLPTECRWWLPTVGPHCKEWQMELLDTLGFGEETLDWEVTRLSTGEKQRLGLCRLLSRSPEALLLDEPTASLDQRNVASAEEAILAYAREHEAPVLWVSHDPAQRARVARRSYVLADGELRPWRGET